jgi:hypothetical protein
MRKKNGVEKGKWGNRGLSKLMLGQNGEGRQVTKMEEKMKKIKVKIKIKKIQKIKN